MDLPFKKAVKAENEKYILAKGAGICDWLPVLETPELRSMENVKGRMSVMNALINIAFEAPVGIIRQWIEAQGLQQHLSGAEQLILAKATANDGEMLQLHWYLESLWALMWATGLTDDFAPDRHCEDYMASLLPNLEQGDNNEKIDELAHMRSAEDLYWQLDLYYRIHWFVADEHLKGRETGFNAGLIIERRRALEWLFNRSSDWDDVDMNT